MRISHALAVGVVAAGLLVPGTAAADVSPYIIGGRESPEPYTFMARLGDSCGATLISPTWAVTAAHCVGLGGSIRIGSLDRTSGGEVVAVAEQIPHPDYPGGASPHDIALLRLASDATSAPARWRRRRPRRRRPGSWAGARSAAAARSRGG